MRGRPAPVLGTRKSPSSNGRDWPSRACPGLHDDGQRSARTVHGVAHDFESRYAETLIGPCTDSREGYGQRSPVHGSDRIRAPFVPFQRTEDRICPPDQAEQFLKNLEGSGVPYTHHPYEGEGHGFRSAATIIHTRQTELALYARTFDLHPTPE